MDSERKKENDLINTQDILVVSRGRECVAVPTGEGSQKVQTSSYKLCPGVTMYSFVTTVNNTVLHI